MPARNPNHWLLKSEPDAFSIDDLAAAPNKTTCWDGVRNYQARNTMRDDMKKGDLVFYYHSNAKPAGIAGIAKVVREAYPDHTAFDTKSKYFDAKSSPENPRWFMVDIKLVRKFKRLIPLEELRDIKALKDMALLQKGSRLSVQPVTAREWDAILALTK